MTGRYKVNCENYAKCTISASTMPSNYFRLNGVQIENNKTHDISNVDEIEVTLATVPQWSTLTITLSNK